jgi:hypothetical protein
MGSVRSNADPTEADAFAGAAGKGAGAMNAAPAPLDRGAQHHHRRGLAAGLVLLLVGVALLVAIWNDVFTGSSSSNAVQGSGVAATQARRLAAFSGVDLAGSNVVTVHVGGRQSVVVHADDNLLGRVTTRVDAGRLVIGNTSGSFATRAPTHVDVSVPSLDGLRLTGSGVVSATGVDAASLTVTVSGSGVLRASGTVTRLDVTLAGSGDAQLRQLVASDVHAVVSGSGRILTTATKSLDAAISGSGAIVYGGNPARVRKSITGSGAITRG